MHLKICGITRLEDLIEADRLGADYVGFIFYPPSPRDMEPEKVAELLSDFQGQAIPVGVFVDASGDHLREVAEITGIQTLQLHGNESEALIRDLRSAEYQIIKGIRMKDTSALDVLESCEADLFLLDAWHPREKGGTGKTFDWSVLSGREKLLKKSMIAGGLHAGNIPEFLAQYKPYGLDISSGVEVAPGIKDKRKLAELFKVVREQ